MYTLPMKRINLFISDQQLEALMTLQKRLGLTLSELIRRAIDLLLRHEDVSRKKESESHE
jgi:Ribbon-helix-helix domain